MNFLANKLLSSKNITHPKMPYVRNRIQDNTERAIEYYQGIFVYPTNNHLIVKLCRILLTQFQIDSIDEMDHYVLRSQLNDFAERVSTTLGIGSNYKNGQLQKTFYDRDYFFFEEINHDPIDEDWTKLQPLKVTSHSRTDISFKVPTPGDSEQEPGIATLTINLYKLLMMLRGYRKLELSDTTNGRYNYKFLLTKYVFPNLLYSHLEVAWYNRLHATYISYPKAKEIKLVGLTLPTAYTYIDTIADQLVSYFVKGKYTVRDLVSNTPGIFVETIHDFYEMGNARTTNPARAYYLLSRYRLLSYLLDLTEDYPDASKIQYDDMTKYLRSCISYGVLNPINILRDEEEEINGEVIIPLMNQGFKLKLL